LRRSQIDASGVDLSGRDGWGGVDGCLGEKMKNRQEEYEERAAIMEFHGNLPREEAERLAKEDVMREENARSHTS